MPSQRSHLFQGVNVVAYDWYRKDVLAARNPKGPQGPTLVDNSLLLGPETHPKDGRFAGAPGPT